jgi:aryl-alcohol dehydrogenase-like predicted oxidoreductase
VPLEETMTAFADLVRAGKVLYVGVSEWNAEEIAAGAALARDLGVQLISNQPQYSMLWRVIEDEVVPTSEKEGLSQIVWSPLAQGVLTGKYLPGQQPPADSRGGHAEAGGSMRRFLRDDVLTRVQGCGRRRGPRPVHGAVGDRVGAAEPNVAAAIIGATRPEQVQDNVAAAGVSLGPTSWPASTRSWGRRRARPAPRPPAADVKDPCPREPGNDPERDPVRARPRRVHRAPASGWGQGVPPTRGGRTGSSLRRRGPSGRRPPARR